MQVPTIHTRKRTHHPSTAAHLALKTTQALQRQMRQKQMQLVSGQHVCNTVGVKCSRPVVIKYPYACACDMEQAQVLQEEQAQVLQEEQAQVLQEEQAQVLQEEQVQQMTFSAF